MKGHTYEKAFLAASGVVLVLCLGALSWAWLEAGIHLPGHDAAIDPRRVSVTPPFDRPGVRAVGSGRYEVVVVGQAWTFSPREIHVPVDAEVTFTATSTDVIHGLHVEGTRLNLMLIPGQVARNSIRFRKPGEYLIICHEYCGLGHHAMAGKVIVDSAAHDRRTGPAGATAR